MHNDSDSNASTLNMVYQNSRTAIEAIDCLIPKAKNTSLKKDLASQILGHHNLIKSSAAQLHSIHHYPQEPNLVAPTLSARIKSAVDSSDGHIAEILIENSTAGMIELQRNLNQRKNLTQEVSALGGEAISFEQSNIDKMRGYL